MTIGIGGLAGQLTLPLLSTMLPRTMSSLGSM
jgi:hypothetical protein